MNTPHEAFQTRAGSPWNHVLEAECVRLWNAGSSALEISKILKNGLTRNSVIGKLHRLKKQGVTMRESTPSDQTEGGRINSRAARREPQRTVPRSVKVKPVPVTPSLVESIAPRPWTERKHGECAYLVTDGLSCCNPVAGDAGMKARYCAGHRAVMVDAAKTDSRKSNGVRKGVHGSIEAAAYWLTRHERVDQYHRITDSDRMSRKRIETVWDAGREG